MHERKSLYASRCKNTLFGIKEDLKKKSKANEKTYTKPFCFDPMDIRTVLLAHEISFLKIDLYNIYTHP